MIYRTLGATGLSVSEVGIGCEGFLHSDIEATRELLDTAQRLGVNCIDLYMSNPQVRSNLGQALSGRRENFVLQVHLCTVWEDGQYKRTRDMDEIQAGFEDALERLQTDSVEIGMIHYVDSVEDWRAIADGPIMQYAMELKKSGKIGSIGLSSHNPIAALEAVESGLIEVLLFSVNPCYDLQPGGENCEDLWADERYEKPLLNMDPDRVRLYETCERAGVGITVMKAFGGGDLLDETMSPAGKSLTPSQCIHYAITRPAVASVLVGAHTTQELEQSCYYEVATDSEKDYAAALASFPKISWAGHCMYCGHCAPCPVGIDVASVAKFLSLSEAQGETPETVREHYEVLPHTAGDGIQCGLCETRCPFEVPVIERMARAAEVFGK